MAGPKVPDDQSGIRLTPVDFDPFAEATYQAITVPLSEAQLEIWSAVQMGPEASCAFNLCFALRLVGAVSTEDLRSSIQRLFDRHEALRLTFDPSGEWQVAQPPHAIDIPLVDLSGLPLAQKGAALDAIFIEEVETPLNLVSGPPARVRMVVEAPDQCLLLLTAHHIVFDGWSAWIFFRELAALYAAARRGETATLPPAEPFSRFALREGQADGREAVKRAQAYWQARFSGIVPVLDLPLDRPRPPVKTYRGAMETLTLDATLSVSIRRSAAQQGATIVGFLFAAFQALLHRLTGQSDVVIGLGVSVRDVTNRETLVGHATNFLPVRVQSDARVSFVTHLRSVKTTLLDAVEQQALTFGTLVRSLNRPWDPSRTPLVATLFNFNRGRIAPEFVDAEATIFMLPRRHINFELEMYIADTGREWVVECCYNPDLFAGETVRRWLGHYVVLLARIVADPEADMDTLPLLTEAELHQAISGWNQAASYPKGACLHERFEKQVERTPDAVALVYEAQRLTYADLNRRANQLAHRLRELGVTPDQLVGLRIERSVEMVIGIVGILKAGGAYLPLDPVYPKDRVAFMLEDSHVVVVLTQKSLVADLEGIAVTRVLLDEPLPGADTNPAPVATADHLAYVIYTSGTTGKPNGALITHYNVIRLFEATEDWYHFDQQDVWTLFHSYAFDFSVWELWGALLYGGRVVIVPYWVSRTPEDFRELLVRERVTVLNQTPSAFRQLIQADLPEPKADLALRYVIFGGEALELQSLRPWFERYGDARPLLVNMYGITETTVHVTYRPIRRDDLESGQGSVIGIPIPDLQVYILDPNGQPVPVGVSGEMYVGGAGVARGYLNRAELTAQRFIADPFASANGSRLYRTGDLARRLENGDIEYRGRLDHQVKIRGFRIELSEIEAVLAEHPDVRQAAVHLWTVNANDLRIVGCCVPEKAGVLAPIKLRKHLLARLPEYMIPQYFLPVEEIPLTPNGKIDRIKLPTPAVTEGNFQQHEAPSDPVEATIAEIWTKLIHPERPIGRNDKFFEMGGHSLLALQALRQMEHQFGVKLELRVLFQESLADIATRCRSQRRTSQGGGDRAAAMPVAPQADSALKHRVP